MFVCMCVYHLLKTVLKNNLVLEVNHQRRDGILKWEGEENEKKKCVEMKEITGSNLK